MELRGDKEPLRDGMLEYAKNMLRYHVAYYLPRGDERMVVAEALDFPGAVSQGFDIADARLMISSAMEELAELLLEEGKPLPQTNPEAASPDADLIELTAFPISFDSWESTRQDERPGGI